MFDIKKNILTLTKKKKRKKLALLSSFSTLIWTMYCKKFFVIKIKHDFFCMDTQSYKKIYCIHPEDIKIKCKIDKNIYTIDLTITNLHFHFPDNHQQCSTNDKIWNLNFEHLSLHNIYNIQQILINKYEIIR